jgi:hypothetical protein
MFYVRINKMKVFDNREGFWELFNRSAELRIYSLCTESGRDGRSYSGRKQRKMRRIKQFE